MDIGYATYRRGKLYFDDKGWAIIKSFAQKTHKSPTTIVLAALRRYIRKHKTQNAK